MWYKEYKDYPPDTPLIHYQVESNKGIIGCEMHEINGWGDVIHVPYRKTYRRPGLIERCVSFFSKRKNL